MRAICRHIIIGLGFIGACSVSAATGAPCTSIASFGEIDLGAGTHVSAPRFGKMQEISDRLCRLNERKQEDSQTVLQAVADGLSVKNNLVNMASALDRYRQFFANPLRE